MFSPLTDANCNAELATVQAGAVIFYKQLCPHCKNMEKVLQKFSALVPGVALFGIDIEENPATAAVHEALRAPTILVIKNGQVTGRKAGLMNPKEMLAFYTESL